MLYPRWLETSRRFADRPAVYGEVTFAELAERAAAAPRAEGPVVARTGGVPFFVEILRAWRDGQSVIPVERDAPEPVLAKDPPAGMALVKYTPGAAGVPRGIFFGEAQVAADADRLVAAMGLSSSVPNLAVISLSHSYGFSNIVLPLLLHGVPVQLVPVPFPRAMEDAFRSHPRVALPAVPSMWRAWQRSGVLKRAPVSLAVSAGAPLSIELEREVFADGLKLRNFYGASECGGISFDGSERPREVATEVGTVLDGVRVRVEDDGRLVVASDAVGCGYDVARDEDRLGAGVYLTRDLGKFDGAGRLHLTGNVSGAINVAGRKVSPAKVEAALLETGLVERARVIALPSRDAERCEEIGVLCEPRVGVELDDLKRAASRVLRNWEIPRQWRIELAWWALDDAELRQRFRK